MIRILFRLKKILDLRLLVGEGKGSRIQGFQGSRKMLRNYKELKVWQKSYQLCLEIYKITTGFPTDEKFGLTSQIRRAVVSIPSNIAEGLWS